MDKTVKAISVGAVVFLVLSLLFAWVRVGKVEIPGEEVAFVMFVIGLVSFCASFACYGSTVARRTRLDSVDPRRAAVARERGVDPVSDYAKLISGHRGYPNEQYPPNDLRHWLPYSIRNPLWRSGCRTMSDVQDKLRSGEHIDYIGEKRQAVCVAAVAEWEKGLVKKTPCGA